VLAETRWNRREAAGQLKISYKALLNKLKKWEVVDPVRRFPSGQERRAVERPAAWNEAGEEELAETGPWRRTVAG
jgi:hypothetical protein